MRVVDLGCTDSASIAIDVDSMVHTDSEVHTTADTGSDTDWVGIEKSDRMLTLVYPEVSHHSSSTRCRPSFPLIVGMLYNPSLHGLLNYKIYRKGLLRYLQSFESIDTPRYDVL